MPSLYQSLIKLFPLIRQYRYYVLTSILLAIPLAFLRLGPAPLVKMTLDELLIKKNTSQLIFFPFFLIGIYVINFFVRFGHTYFLKIVIIKINQQLKERLFHHILQLSADIFTTKATGTLSARISHDPQYIDIGLSSINLIIREPLTLLLLFIYAIKLNWKLTLISIVLAPCLGYLFSISGKKIKRYIHDVANTHGTALSTLTETLQGIRTIKLLNLEKFTAQVFVQKIQKNAGLLLKAARIEEATPPLVELLTAITLAPILYFGASEVLLGKMSEGELFAFFTTFAMMMAPLRNLNDLNIKLNQAAAATDRIFEILKWKSSIPANPSALKKISFDSHICFSEVSFCYPDAPERMILNNLTFTVKKGQKVAIIGSSGSGKTSLMNLLARLFDPSSGSIFIDDINIKNLCPQSLRDSMSVVSQDIFLFNDTIEQNIRLGNLEATSEQIQQAAQAAYAWEFICKTSDGLQTYIGDRGQKLSGGERQRIAIARAFLKSAPILILDEATSHLDTNSERKIAEALENLMQHRTTFIIAHRLSTVLDADQIFVLQSGKIIEAGTHQELLNQNGYYALFLKNMNPSPSIASSC